MYPMQRFPELHGLAWVTSLLGPQGLRQLLYIQPNIYSAHFWGAPTVYLDIEREMFLKEDEIPQIKCVRTTWNPLA